MYLVSAYFDKETNKKLQSYMQAIAKETGNTFMTENKVPPHMTISAIEAKNIEVLSPKFETLKGKIWTGKIKIVSIGQLLPYVFYATPVLNQYLEQLSGEVYNAFAEIEETRISKYYQPHSWLPHITLGKTLTPEQMREAFQVMQKMFAPMEATIVEIGLAKVNPHEDYSRIVL
ncbi:MAG: 2'-5' RNA ligase family protein [Eubacterium sp.]|nr:2'-5' RNA ligase family protein [Eubacterium sp.]